MDKHKIATCTALGTLATGVGLAALIATASGSSAAGRTAASGSSGAHVTATRLADHQSAPSAARQHSARTSRSSGTSVDVTVTSREQVAWTQRAEADTTPAVNKCAPILGADGTPVQAGGGGFVYAARVDDAQAEADLSAMYAAMAAGDQTAYDAAYHRLDLRVNCN